MTPPSFPWTSTRRLIPLFGVGSGAPSCVCEDDSGERSHQRLAPAVLTPISGSVFRVQPQKVATQSARPRHAEPPPLTTSHVPDSLRKHPMQGVQVLGEPLVLPGPIRLVVGVNVAIVACYDAVLRCR